jgi:hypothetical protein
MGKTAEELGITDYTKGESNGTLADVAIRSMDLSRETIPDPADSHPTGSIKNREHIKEVQVTWPFPGIGPKSLAEPCNSPCQMLESARGLTETQIEEASAMMIRAMDVDPNVMTEPMTNLRFAQNIIRTFAFAGEAIRAVTVKASATAETPTS